jgi:hypothetical protein
LIFHDCGIDVGQPKTRTRPATLKDFEGIAAVCGRNGMPIHSREGWERLWTEYPFRTEFEDIPIGWVLEDPAGEIVGSISNVYFMYLWRGERLRAAAAGNWAVDLEHRSASLHLGAQFYQQKNVDLLINGSTSQVASQLMPLYKARRVPSPGYDQSLLWILSPRKVAASALARKKIPGAAMLRLPAGAALWAQDVWRQSGRRSRRPDALATWKFDERFEDFWIRRREGAMQLLAVRTRTLLSWRFGPRLERRQAVIVTLEGGSSMAGYLILNRRDRAGLKNYQVADLQVLTENPDHVQELLLGGLAQARAEGVDVVEMQGFNEFKRTAALALNPHRYDYPFWQTFFKPVRPDLEHPLAQASNWDASPFDSD